MKKGEDWRSFCGVYQNDRPVWEYRILMCTRWHIRGYCFKDCINAASHVKKEKVSAKKEKEFRAWMKKARAAN